MLRAVGFFNFWVFSALQGKILVAGLSVIQKKGAHTQDFAFTAMTVTVPLLKYPQHLPLLFCCTALLLRALKAGCEVLNWSGDLVIFHTTPRAKLEQKVTLWQAPIHVTSACSCLSRKGGILLQIYFALLLK